MSALSVDTVRNARISRGINPKEGAVETINLIQEVYTKCLDGLKRIDLENDTHIVKGYWAGTIIRIDVKEK